MFSKRFIPSLMLFASLSLVFFWLFAAPTRVRAKTITVTTTADNVNALDGQCSLREAIIAANTNAIGGIAGECPPGDDTVTDVIVLADGATYTLSLPGTGEDASATGDLDILDDLPAIDIQIVVENDGTATIDANDVDRVLHVHGATVEVTGVEFYNGFEPTLGGNILNDTGTLTLTNCEVRRGHSGAGGGIYNIDGLVTLNDTVVHLNVAEIVGGGLFNLGDTAALTLDGGAVQYNRTNSGSGGGLSADGGQVILRNAVLILSNHANANGGGINLSGTATISMTSVTVSYNTADNGLGGGLFLKDTDNLTDFYLHDSVFNNNTATLNGGAIAVISANKRVNIKNTDFTENKSLAEGGALSGPRFAILGGTFEGNEAVDNGGAIASTKVSLIGVDFTGNVSGIDGGAIYGAVVTVSDSLFEDNHADMAHGGAIGNYGSGETIALYNVEMKNNSAAFGGALSTQEVYVISSYFDGNTAVMAGGAVYARTVVQINTTTFSQNSAGADGGALYQEVNNYAPNGHFIMNSAFFKNGAANNGGAIWTGSEAGLEIANSTFNKNSADQGGAIHIDTTASLVATNVTFSDNIAQTMGGGLYKAGEATLQNTILNASTNDNCVAAATPFISLGNNIASDTSCNLGGPEDMNNVDPLLDDLAPNGGATLTQALLPGSPAFNAGNDTACAGGFVNGIDQRGIFRHSPCDIGAYEAAWSIFLPILIK